MRVCQCDRCGKIFTDDQRTEMFDEAREKGLPRYYIQVEPGYINSTNYVDLCPACMELLREFLKGGDKNGRDV